MFISTPATKVAARRVADLAAKLLGSFLFSPSSPVIFTKPPKGIELIE